jgi:hypothetical protein
MRLIPQHEEDVDGGPGLLEIGAAVTRAGLHYGSEADQGGVGEQHEERAKLTRT